jgi:predicted metal-dependent RNase
VIGGTSIYVKKRGLLIKRQDQEIKEKLQRLDEMYRNGRISKEAYERLKQEIQEEMEKSKETLK